MDPDREADTESHIHTNTWIQIDRYTHRHRHTQKHTETGTQTHRQTDEHTQKHIHTRNHQIFWNILTAKHWLLQEET